jgi:hypothetical protein
MFSVRADLVAQKFGEYRNEFIVCSVMPAKTSILVCVVLGASLSNARADEPENPVTSPTAPATAPAPAGEGIDQMVLPKGRVLLDAFAEINL